MNGLTPLQEATLRTLKPCGKSNPITGTKIANAIGLKQRRSGKEGADMRSIIHALRMKGYPICATGAGYWWPKTRTELSSYIVSFEMRVVKQEEALKGLKNSFEKISMSLFEAPVETVKLPDCPACMDRDYQGAHKGRTKHHPT